MRSPRFAPAGLLVEDADWRVMIDGGAASQPGGRLHDWLVTDERAELMPELRRLARPHGLAPGVRPFRRAHLSLEPLPVAHTSHPAFGYLIEALAQKVVWAPEFAEFPDWANGADLMFAEAAGWKRPIRFAGGVGGHAAALDVAEQARQRGVRRLTLAHIGRPTIRALEAGESPPFGEIGRDGAVYLLEPRS